MDQAPNPAPGAPTTPREISTFPCASCGAELEFKPGTRSLGCPYCGGANELPEPIQPVAEQDFAATIATLESHTETIDQVVARCDSCGATTQLQDAVTSGQCPFCASNIVATGASRKLIKPGAIIPFAIDRARAHEMFRSWISSRWFAPRDLSRQASVDASRARDAGLAGVYLPYWTFDARATTPYTGQRGDAYYETQYHTVIINGRPQQRPRQVRKVRWRWVGGQVEDAFDDLPVPACSTLAGPGASVTGYYEFKNLAPYDDAYLSGFRAQSYQVELLPAFEKARGLMLLRIQSTIRQDIGGDEQRIHSMDPRFRDITFKHVLAPVWISAYRYSGRVYTFCINGQTGTIAGDRPYSKPKIALLVLAILAAAAVVAILATR